MLPKRLQMLDVSRGVAALAVVFWHWQHFFFGSSYSAPEGFERDRQPLYSVFFLLYHKGALAVPFFFVLSGFVFFWLYRSAIADRSCSLRKFVILRFARLYPLHLLTLLIVLVLQFAYCSTERHFFVYPLNNSYHFALHLLFASNWGLEHGFSFNAPIWSVSIEIGLYAIFFAIAFCGRSSWQFALGVVLTGVLIQYFGYDGLWIPAIEAFFIGGLVYYFINWYAPRRSLRVDCLIVGSLMLLCFYCLVFDRYLMFGSAKLYLRILYPLIIASLVVLELRFENVGSNISWIGDITYSSYLMHFPLQLAFVIVVSSLGMDREIFYSPLLLFLYFGFLIPLSLFTFHWFERPAQRVLRSYLLAGQGHQHSSN